MADSNIILISAGFLKFLFMNLKTNGLIFLFKVQMHTRCSVCKVALYWAVKLETLSFSVVIITEFIMSCFKKVNINVLSFTSSLDSVMRSNFFKEKRFTCIFCSGDSEE